MIHSDKISNTLYLAKGIGITLVVFGHSEAGADIWRNIIHIIYFFHMPLFMMVSGYLFSFSAHKIVDTKSYLQFVKNKSKRLLFPYFSVTFIVLLQKIIAQKVFTLQYPVSSDFYKYILLNPMGGFATSLWFLYTLLVIFIIFPLLRYVCKNDAIILIISLVLFLCYNKLPHAFCLNLTGQFLVYFTVGFLLSKHEILKQIPDNGILVSLLASMILFGIAATVEMNNLSGILSKPVRLLAGISGCFSVIFLCFVIAELYGKVKLGYFNATAGVLKEIGIYSMSIYLFHTIPMGVIKVIFFQILGDGRSYFFITGIIACSLGILLPILAEKYFLKRIPLLSTLFLGA